MPATMLLLSTRHAAGRHYFPTRRSSDLVSAIADHRVEGEYHVPRAHIHRARVGRDEENFRRCSARRISRWRPDGRASDRKSTRLNSSHLGISYAVFCLKKKNT